jgi:hypothetical protein
MLLVGANPQAKITGIDPLAGKSNYLIGSVAAKWHTNVPTYTEVRYADVYPGVNLIYYGNQRQLEYDFVVQPGADPTQIALDVGAVREPLWAHHDAPLRIDGSGDLVIRNDNDEVRFRKPTVYQLANNGSRRYIDGQYVIGNLESKTGNERPIVGFKIAAYDHSRPLVIDPVLTYSTYLGGTEDEGIFGIAWDAGGNFYVTGETSSPDFPTLNAFQPKLGGNYDGFVSKFDPTGSTLLYSTYLGGSQFDHCVGIAVDAEGSARVAGFTQSSDFPTFNALQSVLLGPVDAFVARLDTSGSKLVFSTYLGGSDVDSAAGVALDASGNTYVTGSTYSIDFPITSNAFQKLCDQGVIDGTCFGDAFITKLSPTGSKLVYSTYLGGNATDSGNDIAVDRAGNIYLTGLAGSSNFPTTAQAFEKSYVGNGDAFVTKLNAEGSRLVYSTYLGGTQFDAGGGIALDVLGNAYVTGSTQSTDFPVQGAVQPACSIGPPGNFCGDAFVTKLNSTGSRLVYSTYLGGTGFDVPFRIAVDALGSASVTGLTSSPDFPIANAVQPTYGGGADVFVTKYGAAGSAYLYSTYLGGSGDEFGYGTNVDGAGNVWVTGSTSSPDFPLVRPYQGTYAGGPFDAYISKISLAVPQSLDVLEGEVRNLMLEGILNHGRSQVLLNKLQKAREDVLEGEGEDARKELRAFIERVEDYVNKGVLTAQEGGRLRSAAQDIMSRLSTS